MIRGVKTSLREGGHVLDHGEIASGRVFDQREKQPFLRAFVGAGRWHATGIGTQAGCEPDGDGPLESGRKDDADMTTTERTLSRSLNAAARAERADRLAADARAIERLCALDDRSLARVLGAPVGS